MAGTLQTLILTASPAQTLSSRHRGPHFPSNCGLHYSSSVNRSIYRPIRALEGSNQVRLAPSLVSGVALGLANPSLGCLADRYSLSKFSTFGIFIISGLTLRSGDIGAAAEAWPVGVFGLVSILICTPFFSRAILQMQLQPQEFVTGLAIFSCMPTTLSSGVALTQLAGGNSALALAMTLISNLLGILIVPFSISKYIADGVGVSLPTKQLFKSLVLTLLIPLILGKVFRESFKGLADFVDHNRKLLSKLSALFLSPKDLNGQSETPELHSFQFMLCPLIVIASVDGGYPFLLFGESFLVPWIQVSRSRSLLLMVKPEVFLVAIGLGVFMHLILLAFNTLGIQSLSVVSGGSKSIFSKKENASALVLVASQKTLPVMVAVVEQLGGAFGESGLLVLPCVAAHLSQIVMDSLLVNFWFRKNLSSNS